MAENAAEITVVAQEAPLASSVSRGISRGIALAGNDLRQFDQQLDRANKRVVAFGASASLIYGTIRAFKELVAASIAVEKSLTSINSIFQLSSKELDQFSKSLFDIARSTGQSFTQVAKAAEEFSRQGLGAAETAKRTRDAMLLVRLTGLDAAKSVDLLTASMNTFGKMGENTTSILNKLVAVDQRFAVSARDIAEAISRTASVVDDANVSLDEFTGLVTAARQITSRDGTVIGNSLKTIFTRLERSSTLDQLESFGIAVRDASGNAKSVLEVFDNVAKAYQGLSREQQNQVAELGAGVFQINQFKALLLDLGKANGIAAQATKASAEATDEALIRNATLNETMAASIDRLKASATEAAATVGKLSIFPAAKTLVNVGNLITDAFRKDVDTKPIEEIGLTFGDAFLKGLGNAIVSAGLPFLARVAGGLLKKTYETVKSDAAASAGFISVGGARQAEVTSLTTVNGLLEQGTNAERKRYEAAKTTAEAEAVILGILERQILAQAELAAAQTSAARVSGGVRGGARTIRRAAEGYVPTAANGISEAIHTERQAINAGVGGATPGARPVVLPSFKFGNGKVGPLVANTSEYRVPNLANGGDAIFNQDMIKKHGLPPGAVPIAAGGYNPPNVRERLNQIYLRQVHPFENNGDKYLEKSRRLRKLVNKREAAVLSNYESGLYSASDYNEKTRFPPSKYAGPDASGEVRGPEIREHKPIQGRLFHVTTNRSAVLDEGLKSKAERKIQEGAGLGGGPDDRISFTNSFKTARGIQRGLVEANAYLNGKFTFDDMVKQAKQYGIEKTVESYAKSSIGRGFSFDKSSFDSLSESEKFSLYNAFNFARENAGGPYNPVFAFNSTEALKKVNPKEIRIIEYQYPEGARGQYVPAENEFRLNSSKKLKPVNVFAKGYIPTAASGSPIGPKLPDSKGWGNLVNMPFTPPPPGSTPRSTGPIGLRRGATEIGRGSFGAVLKSPDKDIVFKRFLGPDKYTGEAVPELIRQEYAISKLAEQLGLPVAKVYGTAGRSVKRGGLYKEFVKGTLGSQLPYAVQSAIETTLTDRFYKKGIVADDLRGVNYIVRGGYDPLKGDDFLKNTVVVDPGNFYLRNDSAGGDVMPSFNKAYHSKAEGYLPTAAAGYPKGLGGYLKEIDPSYLETFKGLARKDPQLARFLNKTIDQVSPQALREFTDLIGGKHVQVTPSAYNLGSTTYLNLEQEPQALREAVAKMFGGFKMKSPLAASGYVPTAANAFYRGVTSGNPLSFKYGSIWATRDKSVAKEYLRESGDYERSYYKGSSALGSFALNKGLKILNIASDGGSKKLLSLFAPDSFEYNDIAGELRRPVAKRDLFTLLESNTVKQRLREAGYDVVQLNEFDRDNGFEPVGKSVLVLNEKAITKGKIKQYASGYFPSLYAERAAINARVGGAPTSARPVVVPSFRYGGGKVGPIVANTSEYRVPTRAGGDAIYTQDMVKTFGLPKGSQPLSAAHGYVPTAAVSYQPGELKVGGSYAPFNLDPQRLNQLNGLFDSLSKASTVVQGSSIGVEIQKVAGGLETLSKSRVLADLATHINLLVKAEQQAAVVRKTDFAKAEAEITSRRSPVTKEQASRDIDRQRAAAKKQKDQEVREGFALLQRRSKLTDEEIRNGEEALAAQEERIKASERLNTRAAKQRGQELLETNPRLLPVSQVAPVTEPKAFYAPKAFFPGANTQGVGRLPTRDSSAEDIRKAAIAALPPTVYGPPAPTLGQQVSLALQRDRERNAGSGGLPPSNPPVATAGGADDNPPSRKPYPISNEGLYDPNSRLTRRLQREKLAADEEEQRRIKQDLANDVRRAKAQQELKAKQDIEDRANRRASTGNRIQGGLLAASFATGFIPEGQSGEASGKASGAITGGIQGANLGAGLGAFFGPTGIIAGAIGGGLLGAVKGFIDRSKKSFEELAAAIEEANSRSAQALDAAAQFISLQGNIKEAVDRGQSPKVIDSLVRQQRSVGQQLPGNILRQLLEAGFDETKQQEAFTALSSARLEEFNKNKVASTFFKLGDNSNPLSAGALKQGAALIKNSIEPSAGAGIKDLLSRINQATASDSAFNNLGPAFQDIATNSGGGPLAKFNEEIQAQLGKLVEASKLDPAQQKEFVEQIKGAKTSRLIQFLRDFQSTPDNSPIIDVDARANTQLQSIRTPLNNLLRSRQEQLEIGQIVGSAQNRSIANRQRATLGLGDLTDQASLTQSGRFNLESAQRDAFLSNNLALEGLRSKFATVAADKGADKKVVQSIFTATTESDFRTILKDSFKGNDIANELSAAVTELKKTTTQNDLLIQLTREQNRIDQLLFEAQQNQRLLGSGTFGADTRATSRSLFSRLDNSRGAANTSNAIDISSFLTQIGLPQTDEGLQFDRETRSASVRDNLSALLSGRLRRRVGSGREDLIAANEELSQGTGLADQITSTRITAALKSLDFDPQAARRELTSGGLKVDTIKGLYDTGQIDSKTLVLKSPLDAIAKTTEGTNELLKQIEYILEETAEITARKTLDVKAIGLNERLNSAETPVTDLFGIGRELFDNRLEYQKSLKRSEARAYANSPTYSDADLVALSGGIDKAVSEGLVKGAETAAPQVKAIMMDAVKVGVGKVKIEKGTIEGLRETFNEGFSGALDKSVRGSQFKTIEEALLSLSDVGAKVANSLHSNLDNAFGDFVTGAAKGKDAFRQFALGVLNDSARAFASKAVQQLLGVAFNTFSGAATTTPVAGLEGFYGNYHAKGGYVGLANGGLVPVALTEGEYMFGPAAAKRLGGPILNALNNGTYQKRAGGGIIRGGGSGYRDDIFGHAPAGSFVVKKAMAERYGGGFLNSLANGSARGAHYGYADGGAVANVADPMMTVPTPLTTPAASGTGASINIGVTLNDNSTTTQTTQQGAGIGQDRRMGDLLGARIKDVVLQTLQEQQRTSGSLSRWGQRSLI